MFYRFFSIFFFALATLSAAPHTKGPPLPPLTVQQVLPLPFCYFENLYFDTSSTAFLGCGPRLDPNKAMLKDKERGYSFHLTNKKPLPNNPQFIQGTTLFLFENQSGRKYLSHYFHLLEHVVGIWSFYGDQHAKDVRLIVLAGNGETEKLKNTWKGPNDLNLHLLKALFPNAAVKTWRSFLKTYDGLALRFDRAVTSDRALTSLEPECGRLNKMLAVARFDLSQEAIGHLADRVHAYANTVFEKTDVLRVTYLKRPFPRALSADLEASLLQSISMLGNIALKVVDFAKISFQEQIHTIGNTDVLISVHGNGLSHVLYLPGHAGVIEIFPPNSHALDYRLFGEARGLEYLGIMSKGPVLNSKDAYELGAFGEVNTTIYELDFLPILSFIRNRL